MKIKSDKVPREARRLLIFSIVFYSETLIRLSSLFSYFSLKWKTPTWPIFTDNTKEQKKNITFYSRNCPSLLEMTRIPILMLAGLYSPITYSIL